MNPNYPNLKLMEYIFLNSLYADEEWVCDFQEKKMGNKYLKPDIDVQVFPQMWGNTCTAFDMLPDGSPTVGGCAITKAYTVVFEEHITETFGVFVNDKCCYRVKNATEAFYKDLQERNLVGLREAKERY